MKKLVISVVVVTFAAFLVITLTRRDSSDAPSTKTESEDVSVEQKDHVTNFWALYNQADDRRVAGDHMGAISLFKEALKLNPEHETSLYSLANMLAYVGRYDDAIATFKRLAEVNPRGARPHRRQGEILSSPSPGAPLDLDLALASFEEALRLNTEESGIYYWMGRVYLELGRYHESRESTRNATRLNPKFPDAFPLLAYADMLEGNYGDAMVNYTKALDAEIREIAPDRVPGEGDTKRSLTNAGTTARENIDAFFGLAVAGWAGGGYADEVPDKYRAELPPCDGELKRVSATFEGKSKAHGVSACWTDYDTDGDPDLVVLGQHSPMTLWRNEGGYRFVEATASANLSNSGYGWRVLAGDIDGDGDQDLYKLRGGWSSPVASEMFLNDSGVFHQATGKWQLPQAGWTAQAAFADVNRDGQVDLIEIGRSRDDEAEVRVYALGAAGLRTLWRNVIEGSGFPLECAVGDFDNDSYPDLFVLRWHGRCILYRNMGGTGFEDVTEKSGMTVDFESLSASFIDYNNDGRLDLFVSALALHPDALHSFFGVEPESEEGRPALFKNKGDGSFERIAPEGGLDGRFGTMHAATVDVNGDGWLDIFLANGGLDPAAFEPDAVLLNQKGKSFTTRYLDCMPPKSLFAAVTDTDSGGPLVFVTKGGLVPGETEGGLLYVIDRK